MALQLRNHLTLAIPSFHTLSTDRHVRMLLGIFAARGVLPLEFKPAHGMGDLVVQHLDELERQADEKGGVPQLLMDHFANVYKIRVPDTAHRLAA